jgi:serine/threonine protein kinase
MKFSLGPRRRRYGRGLPRARPKLAQRRNNQACRQHSFTSRSASPVCNEEAQLLASLNHLHIAAIYGLEEADGAHLLILELVDGQTLADLLRRGPLALGEVLTIARQVAEALGRRTKGIIHRDLKPANIA